MNRRIRKKQFGTKPLRMTYSEYRRQKRIIKQYQNRLRRMVYGIRFPTYNPRQDNMILDIRRCVDELNRRLSEVYYMPIDFVEMDTRFRYQIPDEFVFSEMKLHDKTMYQSSTFVQERVNNHELEN